MNEVIKTDSALPTPEDLNNYSTQTLREELVKAVTMTARSIQYLATVWKELERRGEDLSDLRTGLASYLPLIAAGQLDAEVVVCFAGNKTLLQCISRLPIDDQRRLSTGGLLNVVIFDDAGKSNVTRLPAHALTTTQARMVFDEGRIRGADEQRTIAEARAFAKRTTTVRSSGTIVADPKTGMLKVGRTKLTSGDVMAALVELSEASRDNLSESGEKEKTLILKLTEAEHRKLRVMAAEKNITLDSIFRMALSNAGLI